QVQRAFGNTGKARKEALQVVAQTVEGTGKEGKLANGNHARQNAHNDVNIGAVIAEHTENVEQRAVKTLLERQLFVDEVIVVRKFFKAFRNKIGQAEEFYFLGGLVVGADEAQVIQFATFGGPTSR